jgi:tripartite-type tricarboxylate transporter receptor subunit TctC
VSRRDVGSWHKTLAPKDLKELVAWLKANPDKATVGMLHAALVETLADPTVRQRLVEIGQGTWPREQQTPEALAAQQKAEIEKWWPIIKAANIRGE